MRRAGLAGLIVVLLVAGVLVWISRGRSSGPPHPKQWDARLLPFVRFVEKERGLRFRYPVAVEYLSDGDFRRAVADEADHSGTDEGDADDERVDRALGLPGGPHGLSEAAKALSGEAVSAFYDDRTRQIKVRGTDLDVQRRATLVHELTHALQDQHFDISRDGTYSSDDRNAAFDAVVEGDAVRIQNAYVASLPKREQDAYDKDLAAEEDTAAARFTGAPDWLDDVSDFPYSVGYPFTDDLASTAGRPAVDEAFRVPPRAVAYVVDAERYRRGDRPVEVAAPPAPPGARVLRRNDLGELRWLLLLAERLPASDAFQAAQGWAGDAYLASEAGGRVCVTADFAGVGQEATDAMAAALRRWAAAMPAASGATVTRRAATVEVASCDPGAAAFPAGAVAGSHADEAMNLLVEAAGGSVPPAGGDAGGGATATSR